MVAFVAPMSPGRPRPFGRPQVPVLLAAIAALAALMAGAPGPAGASAFVAGTSTSFTSLSGPRSVALGDLNNDGITDMVVGHETGSGYSSFRGLGGGLFAARIDNFTAVTTGSVVLADFDRDGYLDVAMTAVNIARIIVQKGNGNATFDPSWQLTTAANPQGLVAIDLNNDGKPDLATAGYPTTSTGTISVYLNTSPGPGTIAFAARVDYACGGMPNSIAAGWLTNSSICPDLVTANYNNGGAASISILQNNGSGGFGNRQDIVTCKSTYSVAVGPLFDDPHHDQIVIANRDSASVTLLSYDDLAAGWSRHDYPTAAGPRFVTIADPDGDANLDVVAAAYDANKISILTRNPATGWLNPKIDVTASGNPLSVAVGNLNGDLKPDLLFSGRNTTNVVMVRGAPKRGWAVGDTIPTFSAPNQQGGTFNSAAMAGSWTVLDLCSVWCNPCKAMAHWTQATYAAWLGHPTVHFDYVTALADGEVPGTASTQAEAEAWGSDYGISRPILHSGGVQGGGVQGLATLSEATATPTLRLVAPDGRILWLQRGSASDTTMIRLLANAAGVAMPATAYPSFVSATETVTHGAQQVSSPSDPSSGFTFPYNVSGFGANFTSDFLMTRDLDAATEHWSVNLWYYQFDNYVCLPTDDSWQLTLTNVVLDPFIRNVLPGMTATVTVMDTFWVDHTLPVTVPVTWSGGTLTLGAIPAAALAAIPAIRSFTLDWTMKMYHPILDVPEPSPAQVLALRSPRPNPATSASRLAWAQARAGMARLEVFDLEGRRLRTLQNGVAAPGEHVVLWDLADDQGSHVGPGLYFTRLTVEGEGTRTQRITVIR